MSVKFKTVKNDLPKMEAAIKELDGKKVNVGVSGEHSWLAGIHEYGCRIKVTEKMRAYLHYQGLHLKESTTEIVIPERSFLRGGFDANHVDTIDRAEKILGDVFDGTMSVDQFCAAVGLELASRIKDYAVNLKSPPKHPFTLAQHPGKSNPLVFSGEMIGVGYDVEEAKKGTGMSYEVE